MASAVTPDPNPAAPSPDTLAPSLTGLIPAKASLKPEDVRDPEHPVAQAYLLRLHQRARTDHLGADPDPHYRPHEQLSNPLRPHEVTLEELLAAQAHLGHATSRWNPANARYIHGIRGSEAEGPIHIISLDATASHLRRAAAVVRGVTERAGMVLFVGSRPGQARCVVRAAALAQGYHLFDKWVAGTLTNRQQILGRARKRVVDERDREVLGFQDQLRVQAALKPDLVVCLNPRENYILLHECGLAGVPTIGVIDTDADPTWVTYPIPANDDSLRCVQLIAGVLGRAGEQGQQFRKAAVQAGRLPEVAHRLAPPTEGQAERELEEAAREAAFRQRQIDEGLQVMHADEVAAALARDASAKRSAAAAAEAEEEMDEAADGLQSIDPSLLRNA